MKVLIILTLLLATNLFAQVINCTPDSKEIQCRDFSGLSADFPASNTVGIEEVCVNFPDAPGCNVEKPARDIICLPRFYVGDQANGVPICSKFKTRKEAEINYFHCEENAALTGNAVRNLLSTFEPAVYLEDFLKRRFDKDCLGNSFEIYPDSRVCSQFETWKEAEGNYYHCNLHVFQLWTLYNYLTANQSPSCQDAGDFKDAAFRDLLWKPEGDPKALCRGGTVILFPPNHAGRMGGNLTLLDSNFAEVTKARYINNLADGRPRYCTDQAGQSYPKNLTVYYTLDGVPTCRSVDDPSKRHD